MKSSYCILKDENLIVEYHEGVTTLQDLIAFRMQQGTDVNFSPTYNLISDIRNLTFDAAPSDIDAFAAFHKQNPNLIGKRKNAVLTETPDQVVLVTMFDSSHIDLLQSIHIVSTISAAISWVRTGLSVATINSILDDLKGKAK